MKRVLLLGVVILFASSMAMALALDGPAQVIPAGAITGDLDIGITVNTDATASATTTVSGQADLATDGANDIDVVMNVGATGSVTVAGQLTATAGKVDSTAQINIEGALSVGGNMTYEGGAVSGAVDINISGSGSLEVKGLCIFGGYAATYKSYSVDVSGSGSIKLSAVAGNKTMYIGGNGSGNVEGETVVTLSGNAYIDTRGTATAGNKLNIGSTTTATVHGELNLASSGTYARSHQIFATGGSTLGVTIDAGGTGQLQQFRPGVMTWGYCWLMQDFVIDINDTIGAAVGSAYDIVVAADPGDLKWEDADDGTNNYGAQLSPEDYAAWWRLREKPGAANILQIVLIPEPTTMALLGIGGLLLAIRRRS